MNSKGITLNRTKYYCEVDKSKAVAEYLVEGGDRKLTINENPNLFITKLFGVALKVENFSEEGFKSVVTLELCDDDFINKKSSRGNLYVHQFSNDFYLNNRFAIITLEEDALGKSVLYGSYDNSQPKRIRVTNISFQSFDSPRFFLQQQFLGILNSPRNNLLSHSVEWDADDYELLIFGVGQGMCSLLRSKSLKNGLLFDIGAGTPVKRGFYLQARMRNDLLTEIQKLDDLRLILSHFDSDHYRILTWCTATQRKISIIYAPENVAKKPLFYSKNGIKSKVRFVSRLNIRAGRFQVEAFRTKPNRGSTENNDNELVTHIKKDSGKENYLFPGDYVYKKFRSDKQEPIKRLVRTIKFDFVVAPHHGDYQSASNLAAPKSKDISEVFFSAGDHLGYKHPTYASVIAHLNKGFNVICYNPSKDIVKVKSL